MITTYATVAQFFAWGMPQTALGSKTVADVQSALDVSSSEMDDYFRGRFPLPLASVGISVSRRCVAIAVNTFLGGRGFSPVTGADQQIIANLAAAEKWCDEVQRRVKFPDIVVDPSARMPTSLDVSGSAQPIVLSSSCVDVSTGRRAATRCW